jgi:hypothetical protein
MKELPPVQSPPTLYYEANIHDRNNCQKRKFPQSGKVWLGTLNTPDEEDTVATTKRAQCPEFENINEDEQQLSSILGEFILSDLAAHNKDSDFWNEVLDPDIANQEIRMMPHLMWQ